MVARNDIYTLGMSCKCLTCLLIEVIWPTDILTIVVIIMILPRCWRWPQHSAKQGQWRTLRFQRRPAWWEILCWWWVGRKRRFFSKFVAREGESSWDLHFRGYQGSTHQHHHYHHLKEDENKEDENKSFQCWKWVELSQKYRSTENRRHQKQEGAKIGTHS